MSLIGTFETSINLCSMVALGGKADMPPISARCRMTQNRLPSLKSGRIYWYLFDCGVCPTLSWVTRIPRSQSIAWHVMHSHHASNRLRFDQYVVDFERECLFMDGNEIA